VSVMPRLPPGSTWDDTHAYTVHLCKVDEVTQLRAARGDAAPGVLGPVPRTPEPESAVAHSRERPRAGHRLRLREENRRPSLRHRRRESCVGPDAYLNARCVRAPPCPPHQRVIHIRRKGRASSSNGGHARNVSCAR
jgi:hypothetical protein